MAYIENTVKMSYTISPPATDSPWGSHYSKYGIGGLQQVADVTQMNAIPITRVMTGSIAYVTTQNKYYKWSNSIWNQIIPLSPDATFGQSYYAGSGLSIDGNNTFSIDLSGSNGIDITSNTISVQLDNYSGLRFDSGKLTIDLYGSSLGLNSSGIYVANVPTHTHDYLPLSGGILDGQLSINAHTSRGDKMMLSIINVQNPVQPIQSSFENTNKVKYITQLTSPDTSIDYYKLKYYKDENKTITDQDLMTFQNNYGVTFDLDNHGEYKYGMVINGIGEPSPYSEKQRLLTLKTQKGTWDKDIFTHTPGWPQMLFVDGNNNNNTALTYDSSHDIFHIGHYIDYGDMTTFTPFIIFDRGNSVIQINAGGSMQDVYHTGNLPDFATLSHTHTQYIRSDTSDTFTGKLTATGDGQISGSELEISAKQVLAGAVISNGTPNLGVWPNTGQGFIATYYYKSTLYGYDVGRLFAYDGDGGYKDLAIGNWNSGNPNIMLKGNTNPADFGFVGIGIGSPQEQLHVAGNVSASYFKGDGSLLTGISPGQTYDAGNGLNLSTNTFSIDNTIATNAGVTSSFVSLSGNSTIYGNLRCDGFNSKGINTFYSDINKKGYFNINVAGTTCSIGGRDVNAGIGLDLTIGADNSFNPIMIVRPNGTVGIGTMTPTQQLQVVGTISASSYIGDGSQLTNLPLSGQIYDAGYGLNLDGNNTFSVITHTHSYLPLTGGTLTGMLTIDDNIQAQTSSFRQLQLDDGSSYYSTFKHNDSTLQIVASNLATSNNSLTLQQMKLTFSNSSVEKSIGLTNNELSTINCNFNIVGSSNISNTVTANIGDFNSIKIDDVTMPKTIKIYNINFSSSTTTYTINKSTLQGSSYQIQVPLTLQMFERETIVNHTRYTRVQIPNYYIQSTDIYDNKLSSIVLDLTEQTLPFTGSVTITANVIL